MYIWWLKVVTGMAHLRSIASSQDAGSVVVASVVVWNLLLVWEATGTHGRLENPNNILP